MVALLSLCILPIACLLGWRRPGILLAGCLFTYQAGAVSGEGWIGSAYVALAGAISLYRFYRRPRRLAPTPVDGAMALLVVYLVVSIAWAPTVSDAPETATQLLLSVVGMYAIGRVQTGDPRILVRDLVLGIVVIGAVLSLCMIAERVTETLHQATRLYVENEAASVVGLSMPLPYAIVAAVIAMFLLPNRFSVVLGAVALGIVLYASVVSATRSVFLAAVAGLVVTIVLALRRIRVSRMATFGVAGSAMLAIVAGLLPTYAADNLARRFFGNAAHQRLGSDASSAERIFLFKDSVKAMSAHPVFGTGFGSFRSFSFSRYPHNMFLELGSTAGAIGVLLVTLWLALVLAALWRGYRRDAAVGAILLGFFAIVFVQLQVSFAFFMARPLFLLSALAPLVAGGPALRRLTDAARPQLAPRRRPIVARAMLQ